MLIADRGTGHYAASRKRPATIETAERARPPLPLRPVKEEHGLNESEMVERCRRGERAAQRRLYELTSGSVFRLCRRITGNEDDAFDLAQDTYLRAFERIAEFEGTARVTTWLFRIAFNEALQFRRRQGRETARRPLSAKSNTNESADDATVRRLDVESALATLPMEERITLLLRYQEGLDYREIAEVLECSSGTVGSRLNRARIRLRDKLQKSYDSREETYAADHPNEGGTDSWRERRGTRQAGAEP